MKLFLTLILTFFITDTSLLYSCTEGQANRNSISNIKEITPEGSGFAVVELFTSEGCSSCPPADELVNGLYKEAEANHSAVYFLNFHVDYWNRLGWKDPFSDKAYSERQSWYANFFGSDKIYTPQMVINGTTEFVGSSEDMARVAIKAAINKKASVNIKLQKHLIQGDSIKINYEISGQTPDELLSYALIERNLYSDIKRGENEGRKLFHSSVVRVFEQIKSSSTGTFAINYNLRSNDGAFEVIVFLQNKQNGHISGANKINF